MVIMIPIRIIKHVILIGGWFGIWMCAASLFADGSITGIGLIITLVVSLIFLVAGIILVYNRSFDKDAAFFKYYSLGLGILGLIITVISLINGGTLADSAMSCILAVLYSLLFIVIGIIWIISDKKPNGFSYKINRYLRSKRRRL